MLQGLGSSTYWHETSQRVPNPAVTGRHDVDVAIVGGGYTGLWTAYHLLEADPSLRVAVMEREVIGFGASGRNGGFAMTLLDMGLDQLRCNYGDARAAAAHGLELRRKWGRGGTAVGVARARDLSRGADLCRSQSRGYKPVAEPDAGGPDWGDCGGGGTPSR